jgi:hypothetical protein
MSLQRSISPVRTEAGENSTKKNERDPLENGIKKRARTATFILVSTMKQRQHVLCTWPLLNGRPTVFQTSARRDSRRDVTERTADGGGLGEGGKPSVIGETESTKRKLLID